MDNHGILIITLPTQHAKLDDQIDLVLGSTTGNVNFTSADVLAQLVLFGPAVAKVHAKNLLGPGHVNAQNQARDEVRVIYKTLAYALETEAAGDRGKLETTGYELSIEVPVTSVGMPGPATHCGAVNTDHLGEFLATCKKSEHTRWIDIRTTLTPDDINSWVEHTGFTNSKKMLLSGFAKKDEVFIQFRCCNGHGKSGWSQSVSVVIGAH